MVAHVLERCLEGYRSSFFIESKWSFSKSWGETSSKWMTRIVALKPVTAGDVGIFQYALHLLGPWCLAIRLGLLATLSGGGREARVQGSWPVFSMGFWATDATVPDCQVFSRNHWSNGEIPRNREFANRQIAGRYRQLAKRWGYADSHTGQSLKPRGPQINYCSYIDLYYVCLKCQPKLMPEFWPIPITAYIGISHVEYWCYAVIGDMTNKWDIINYRITKTCLTNFADTKVGILTGGASK